MATLLTHAALPLLARRAVSGALHDDRRLWAAAVACACLPDLDLVGLAFEVRETDVWGHRGLSHSLAFALGLALVVGLLGLYTLGWGTRRWRLVVGVLFFSTASHGVLDTLTRGGVGVALFAPFDPTRYLAPWGLIPVCPGGVPELLGRWGLLVLLNEALFVVLPVALLTSLIRRWRLDPAARRDAVLRYTVAAGAWLGAGFSVRAALPGILTPTRPRVIRPCGPPDDDEDVARIPVDPLPEHRLVTGLDELRRLGLFDRELRPAVIPWSSSFFPWWFGGEAGRWQDSHLRLIGRTLMGTTPPSEAEAKGWLEASGRGDARANLRLFSLAPTEKVDLALGDLAFTRTRATLERTHNGSPRFWFGRCNGIAGAAQEEPEPFRMVEVIGQDGQRLRFHPNDIKALLAAAYYATDRVVLLGGRCSLVAFDSAATCSMNPAGLVLSLLNWIGRAHQGFLVDTEPTPANQYYAIAGAVVRLEGEPRPAGSAPLDPDMEGRVTRLVEVAIELTLSSTTLPLAAADEQDRSDPQGTRYRKMGLQPVVRRYRATLALDSAGNLIGGMWTGDPAEGPDSAAFKWGGPKLVDGGAMLAPPEVLPWPLIRDLARASADDGDDLPTLDLRRPAGSPSLGDGGQG